MQEVTTMDNVMSVAPEHISLSTEVVGDIIFGSKCSLKLAIKNLPAIIRHTSECLVRKNPNTKREEYWVQLFGFHALRLNYRIINNNL